MAEPVVLYEKKDHIAKITINRPDKMNAYNAEVLALEAKYFTDFRDDPDMLVAILTGTGDKAFIAGADMRMVNAIRDEGSRESETLSMKMWHMGDIPVYKPIIAAINGYCLSGGLTHAVQCDIRIAAEHATFGYQQVRFGAVPSPEGAAMLPKYIGLSNALYLILTGARISAQEALRMGFVHKVVPSKDLMPAALEMAELLKMNSPTHLRAKKEAALRGVSLPIEEAKMLSFYFEGLVPVEESKEGIGSFLEKRKPDWSKVIKKRKA